MSKGEFRKRLASDERWKREHGFTEDEDHMIANAVILSWIDEAEKEYPKVSQQLVPMKGRDFDWKLLCKRMEQKIIEFENFGKRWFGDIHE